MAERLSFYARMVLMLLWLLVSAAAGLLLWLSRLGGPDLNRVFASLFSRGVLRVWGVEVEAEGLETLRRSQPCVIVANHQSALDMATFGSVYPRRTLVIGKKELGWIPLFGWFFAAAGNVMIDRAKRIGSVGGLNAAIAAIRERKVSVWIFPEGTRNRGDCRDLLPFKKGAFHVAIGAGVPVVPVVSSPLEGLVSWEERRMRGGKVRLRVLEPIPTAGLKPADLDRLSRLTRERMTAALRELV